MYNIERQLIEQFLIEYSIKSGLFDILEKEFLTIEEIKFSILNSK